MAGIFHRLLFSLLAIALAVAPLSGALAQITFSVTSSEHHCSQMAHDMHSPGTPVDRHVIPGGSDSGHGCNRGCHGNCCGHACTCVHVAAAIPVSLRTFPLLATAAQHSPLFPGFTQCSLPPPFRPPVSATS
jgi:hypothetical protein